MERDGSLDIKFIIPTEDVDEVNIRILIWSVTGLTLEY